MKVLEKRGQGCWNGKNTRTYVPCVNCTTLLINPDCGLVRERLGYVLTFEDDLVIEGDDYHE